MHQSMELRSFLDHLMTSKQIKVCDVNVAHDNPQRRSISPEQVERCSCSCVYGEGFTRMGSILMAGDSEHSITSSFRSSDGLPVDVAVAVTDAVSAADRDLLFSSSPTTTVSALNSTAQQLLLHQDPHCSLAIMNSSHSNSIDGSSHSSILNSSMSSLNGGSGHGNNNNSNRSSHSITTSNHFQKNDPNRRWGGNASDHHFNHHSLSSLDGMKHHELSDPCLLTSLARVRRFGGHIETGATKSGSSAASGTASYKKKTIKPPTSTTFLMPPSPVSSKTLSRVRSDSIFIAPKRSQSPPQVAGSEYRSSRRSVSLLAKLTRLDTIKDDGPSPQRGGAGASKAGLQSSIRRRRGNRDATDSGKQQRPSSSIMSATRDRRNSGSSESSNESNHNTQNATWSTNSHSSTSTAKGSNAFRKHNGYNTVRSSNMIQHHPVPTINP